ncbi:Ferredoxin, 2Fe-2S [Pseudomonas fluorescens]|uniref:Ferredoxin, 2Fe-2S n=1 Tax=Pseudomonas fluorescens TaxID=294 RepID=A0A5E6TFV5_PSEFL|nr:(2Fe-2S) ferredoxin domain-containing protein [Pseudomonas fluorescens]VVM92269.1 Ferredoxin, 2Fe-2S [Pseudomonas fluorescens]VVO97580.1 Ferredoxin, 2Fe-2S [Pseudomonas fluorescens]
MTDKNKTQETPSRYQRHIFFCVNQRDNNRDCCAQRQGKSGYEQCKSLVASYGLNGQGKVRVNQAGCLNRCAEGPVVVIYPEGIWYRYVEPGDIEEIVDSHLKNGDIVERLRLL